MSTTWGHRLALWVAIVLLPALVVAHAVEHPALASVIAHHCPVRTHGHHGGAPLVAVGTLPATSRPALPLSIAPPQGRVGPAPASAYHERAPPLFSFC